MEVPHEKRYKYGIIDPESQVEEGLHIVLLEKPKPEDAPSNLAIIDRLLINA